MADFHDVRVVRGKRTSIVLDNGKVDEVAESYFQGAAVRALLGGAWGFVKTDSVEFLDREVENARLIASHIHPKEISQLASANSGLSTRVPIKKDPASMSLEEKVELAKDIERAVRVPGVSSSHVFYFEAQFKTMYRNSEGLDVESEVSRVGFGVSAVARRGSELQSSGEIKAIVGGLELFDLYDPFLKAREAGLMAVSLLDASTPKGGKFPVLLDQELGGVFIHEAVGHAAEGDIILEGGSVLEGRLGQRIGSEIVTVIDDPSLNHYGHYPFDDEGSASAPAVLVKDGVLKSYLHSRETAGRLGGRPGNARAQGYSRPVVRMSNTYVANGDRSLEELLRELGDGVYLVGSRGGQVNTAEGIFQFNARRGYLVEKGEIGGLLKDVSLSGRTLEILAGIKALASDLSFNSGGCGKAGQTVPVGDGAPHMLIESATVGGAG